MYRLEMMEYGCIQYLLKKYNIFLVGMALEPFQRANFFVMIFQMESFKLECAKPT